MARLIINSTFIKNRIISGSKRNKLPRNQHQQTNCKYQKQRNVQVHEIGFFKEIIRMF